MPIGKARDLLRTRQPKDDERDPGSLEAYEEGWYALLARQASGDELDASLDAAPSGEAVGSPTEEPPPEAPRLAMVKPLVAVPEAPGKPAGPSDGASPVDPTPPPKASERPRRAEPSMMRIGVRRQEEPGSVYLAYLTSSPHRYYFRGEWWPASPSSISPMHLWRANHLGAHWEIADVERFMATAAALADELIASAPRSAPAGDPDRRDWIARFLSAGWVREFGVSRVAKTLHAVLPELVVDLDPAMISWARGAWLGVRGRTDPRDPDMWLETCELLEDVLVLRSQQLGQIVQRLRSLAPGLAPNGRLGPVMAAFWESYWREAAPSAGRRAAARRTPGRSDRRSSGGRGSSAARTANPAVADGATPSATTKRSSATPRRRAGERSGGTAPGS